MSNETAPFTSDVERDLFWQYQTAVRTFFGGRTCVDHKDHLSPKRQAARAELERLEGLISAGRLGELVNAVNAARREGQAKKAAETRAETLRVMAERGLRPGMAMVHRGTELGNILNIAPRHGTLKIGKNGQAYVACRGAKYDAEGWSPATEA